MHAAGNSAPQSQASGASTRTSLVIQSLRILLPMQGTQVPGQGIKILYAAWDGQIKKKRKEKNPAANTGNRDSVPGLRRFHMQRATKLICCNYEVCTLEPTSHSY